MDLTKTLNTGAKEIVPATVYMGEDITLAAFRFCVNNSYSGLQAMKDTIELLKPLQPKLDLIEDPNLPEALRTAGAPSAQTYCELDLVFTLEDLSSMRVLHSHRRQTTSCFYFSVYQTNLFRFCVVFRVFAQPRITLSQREG